MIAGLKPYPEMRDSGVAWLGSVPDHWDVVPLGSLLTARSEKGRTDLPLLSVLREKGVVLRSDLAEGENHNVVPEDLATYKVARGGDLVINKMKAWQGSLGLSPCDGVVSPAYFVFALAASNRRFAERTLRSRPYVDQFARASDGVRIGQWDLGIPATKRIAFVVPPDDEQAAIIRFLDHADRRIRRSIVAKQKMIRLLEEQKAAIVHRSVTRGLKPDAPMKSSGVDWLGDIPAHWEAVPLKRRIGFQEGPGIMAADFRENGTPLLRISSLAGEIATLDGCNYLDAAMVEKKWSHFAIRSGDYLLTSSGSLGSVCVADRAVEGAIPYTGIIRLWAKDDSQVDMRYARWFFGSSVFETQMKFLKAGVGIEHFGPTHLNRMIFFLPPPDEQKEIAHHLETEAARVGEVILTARREIDLLNEYRARLVADVVTGKLDIRAAAAALSDEALDAPLEADDVLCNEDPTEADFDAEEALEEA